jgi:hypothetical protein
MDGLEIAGNARPDLDGLDGDEAADILILILVRNHFAGSAWRSSPAGAGARLAVATGSVRRPQARGRAGAGTSAGVPISMPQEGAACARRGHRRRAGAQVRADGRRRERRPAGTSGNTSLLATIESIDPIRFEFTLDEASYLRYGRFTDNGAGAPNRGLTLLVTLTLLDESAFSHEGKMISPTTQSTAPPAPSAPAPSSPFQMEGSPPACLPVFEWRRTHGRCARAAKRSSIRSPR